jgi:hypothetical protein
MAIPNEVKYCPSRVYCVDIMYALTVAIIHSSSMSSIYQQHKDEDGFVYMAYSGENHMGWQLQYAYTCNIMLYHDTVQDITIVTVNSVSLFIVI